MGRDGAAVRSFGASVERGLHLAIGMVILAKTLVYAAQFASMSSYDDAELALGAMVVICVGIAALRCLFGTPNALDVVLCTLALVAGSLTPRSGVPLAGAADSPVVHLVEPMLMVIAVRRRGAIASMLVLAVLFVGLRWEAGGTDGLRFGLQEAALILGTALGALVLVSQMRAASARAETVIADQHAENAAHMSAAEIETTAFLHDDLIPTLLAVASLPDAPESRAAARSALGRLSATDSADATTDVVQALRAVAERELLEADVVVRGPRTHLPEAARDAVVGAAAEALRNVARHSGQHRVRITVVRRPTALRIVVADPGDGFIGPPGVGLRVAVIGRIEAVGGTARITSVPGSGTTVELVWRAHLIARLLGMAPDHDRLVRAAVRDPGKVARQACAVLAAGYLATAALLLLDIPVQPASYAGAVGIAAVVGGVTALMSRGPLSPFVLLLVGVVPAAILALALPTVSPEGIGGVESWLIEFSALPALAAAWVVSSRMVLVVLVPNTVVITLVAVELGVPGSNLPHLLLVQPLNALFVAVIVSVCRRAGRVMTAPTGTVTTARTAVLDRVLGATLVPVADALRSAGAPDARAGERGVSARSATLLAHAVRDCLYLPGLDHADLRREVDALRQAGAQVDMLLTERPPASRTVAAALAALGVTRPAQVTISGHPDEVTIVGVPGLSAADAERLPRMLPVAWTIEMDPEATMLTGPPDLGTLIRRRSARQPAPE